MFDCIKVWPQYILPKHFLSGIVYRLTRIEFKPWKNLLINLIVRIYKVDLSQAKRETVEEYISFNDFFTRHLKESARTWHISQNNIISPVDGAISQIGNLEGDKIIQAKGKGFHLPQLLANDAELTRIFKDGSFATLYLSPRDYHRIHMPITGKLIKSIYVPGDLFAVNNATVRNVDNLFARNERFISIFETEIGLMAQIMVGAIFVGSMDTVWLGQITPTKKREIITKEYNNENITLEQAQEFGFFNMGSTVILLFEQNKVRWLNELIANSSIQAGQILAEKTESN